MKKTIIFAAILTVVTLLSGCALNDKAMVFDKEHSSEYALDWSGVYEGLLPSADGEGIKTSLTLKSDGTYKLERTYKKGIVTFIPQPIMGNFTWDKTGSIIHLDNRDGQYIYKVGEGYVQAYDMEGNSINSSLNYTLKQVQMFTE